MNKFNLIIVVFLAIAIVTLAQPLTERRIKRQFQNSNNGFDNDRVFFDDSGEDFNDDRSRQVTQNPIRRPTVAAAPTATTPSIPTTTSVMYRQCLADCQTTNEYNPVCGSDTQSYFNKQKLDCANRCGANVSVIRLGRCQPLG